MKSTIIVALLFSLLSLTKAKAQIILDSVDINQLKVEYIELSCYYKSRTEVSVRLDYGQGYGKATEYLKLQPNQPSQPFHSAMEVLNYFYDHGWLLQQTTFATNGPRVYTLKRRHPTN